MAVLGQDWEGRSNLTGERVAHRLDCLRQWFDALFDSCQYRHVAANEETHLARRFPVQREVDDIGYALYAAQLGEMSVTAKPLHGVGGGVMEIAAYDVSGT